MMYSREEVFEFLVDVLENNDATNTNEDTLLVDTGIDSFGVAMVFLEMDNQYKCFPKEYEEHVDYTKYTVSDLVDQVVVVCS